MTGTRRVGRVLGILLALVAASVLAGCSPAPGPRDSGGRVTASAPADTFSLRTGDCTGPITSGSVSRITLIPCGQEHAWEVISTTELAGTDFPGAGKVQDDAEAFCNDSFKSFIGISVAKSDYDLTMLQPTKETWTSAHDRTVTCLAGRDGGTFTGTLRGVGK